MARPRLLALLALLAAVALTGCGGSGDTSVDALLKDTFGPGKTVRSGRLDLSLNADIAGLPNVNGPVTVRLTGPFQSTGKGSLPKFDFTLAFRTTSGSFDAGAVSTGQKGFLRLNGQAYALSAQLYQRFKQGYLRSQQQGVKHNAPTFSALGVHPREWLRSPRKVGEADVGGTATYHVTAALDVPKLLDDLNRVLARVGSAGGTAAASAVRSITPAQQRQIEQAVSSAKVDIFTGKDDRTLRRLDLAVVLRRTASSKGGSLHFTLEFDDLNHDQTITGPAHAKPLGNLLGALGAAGGSGTSTTPAPSSGSTNPQYLTCVQQAGSDLRKVQACAQYL